MVTEQEIETLKSEFVAWLDDEDAPVKNILQTSETVQHFYESCWKVQCIRHGKLDGRDITMLHGTQQVKNGPRSNFYILYVDVNTKLVLNI